MKLFIDDSIQKERFKPILRFKPSNINTNTTLKECDAILLVVNSRFSLINLSKQSTKYFLSKKPIIILERLDSAVTWVREIDKYPQIVAVIKNRISRTNDINNAKLFCGRYHAHLITKGLDEKYHIPITNNKKNKEDIAEKFYDIEQTWGEISDNAFSKIHSILWDFESSPLSERMNFYKKNYLRYSERTNDIFCVHTIRGGLIGKHREQAKEIVDSLKNNSIKVFTDNCDSVDYQNNFISSKVCVGCWGYGEWTHNDGYAMYSKIVLIKPDSSYVKMDPDIYEPGKRYIPCKPDLSDLREKILYVLNNYNNFIPMLEDNFEYINSITHKKSGKKFWNKINKLINK